MPLDEEALERSENIGDVVALVEQLQTAPDDCPERWATESGPADRAALDLFCPLALRSGSPLLSLDVPRAALATGHGRSTMHHAFGRLRLDSWLGRTTDNGPAGTYELLPVTASHPAFEPVARGGTQGNPPPTGDRRASLISLLQARLAAGQADVTVSQDSAGRWFVPLLCDDPSVKPLPATGQAVGVDAGLDHLLTLSTGEKITNPRHERRDRAALAKAQRRLAKKEKGSANRARARLKVAKIHARIADRRRDTLHKTTTRLVRDCTHQTPLTCAYEVPLLPSDLIRRTGPSLDTRGRLGRSPRRLTWLKRLLRPERRTATGHTPAPAAPAPPATCPSPSTA
ncbi:RNA-guided endonuclease InsQ/TnpB family protein [Streptomyces mirabilis]|uniref:RNA-guided endonuclease InsQ/TnpB family protein n=1 Tax=Streptomyces mirabilis TaxID=68239 RepID=UPI0022583A03|nr:transposase [Streptomyces mirabilis]MCX4429124.1 transposase [Streptomyces mirabilis]MCX4429282.1 transposase [Streptomyces mirabilis]